MAQPPSILRQILRLAGPTTTVAVFQVAAQLTETWLAGQLGIAALAGYALALPFLLLMYMMSAGAMGGGVSSAVARTLGAGREDEASALVLHALIIAAAMGLAFTLPLGLAGRPIFAALGATGQPLEEAIAFARALFTGAVPVWVANTLASVLRGAGNHMLPARVLCTVWVVQPPLAYVLMQPLGLGLPGAGWATAIAFTAASLVMWAALRAGAAGFVPHIAIRPRAALFRRILAVGAIASVMAAIANLTTILLTRQVTPYGAKAIAAYGVGTRLEFMMIPLAFGIGAALTTLVGRQAGAGNWREARHVAWIGAAVAGGFAAAMGLIFAIMPDAIAGLFVSDTEVAAIAARQLRIVGPAFGGLGLGMALYFASQGAGRMRWPFVAAVSRITLAVGGGALLGESIGLDGVFIGIALGLAAYGLVVAQSVRPGVWSPP